MDRGAPHQVEQETVSQAGQLVNATTPIPTYLSGSIGSTPHKVLKRMLSARIVTGINTSTGKETSFADLQQCAQIDQSDRDESPKFEPAQEYSAYPTRCLPQPEGFCLAVTPTHPQSGAGLDD